MRECHYGIHCPWVRGGWHLDAVGKLLPCGGVGEGEFEEASGPPLGVQMASRSFTSDAAAACITWDAHPHAARVTLERPKAILLPNLVWQLLRICENCVSVYSCACLRSQRPACPILGE